MPDKWEQYAQPASGQDKWAQYADKSTPPPAPKSEPHPSDVWSGAHNSSAARVGHLEPAPKPTPVGGWLRNAEEDLRHGGGRTVVGRTLGKMQGRGDEGYTGLEAGVSKGTADFMGSPELGAVETAKGVASMKEHPVKGAWDTAKGLAHMTEIPGMMVGEFPGAVEKAIEILPTATRGAKRLTEVEKAAGDLPVEFTGTYEHLMRAKKLADTGATLPKPVKKFLKTFKKGEPIDYSTARDFYSNLSHLSAKDNLSLTPSMRRQVGLIVQAMREDIGNTAAQVDKAATYYAGMKDYARAMKAARIKNAIVDLLKSKVIQGAVGAGAGYAAAKAIGKEFE